MFDNADEARARAEQGRKNTAPPAVSFEKYLAHEREFEIQLVHAADEISVYSFLLSPTGRIRVSPKYCASYEVAHDFFQRNGDYIGRQLLAIAKSDIDDTHYLHVSDGETHEPHRIRPNLRGM